MKWAYGIEMKFAFILSLACFVFPAATVGKPSRLTSNQFLDCQSTLKRFALHLEKCKTRTNQAYYEDLFNQAQNLINNPSQSKCESLIKTLHEIVGNPAIPPSLGPMPSYESPSTGKLTNPAVEARRRHMLRNLPVRYVCEDHSTRKHTDEEVRELEELDDFPLNSRPNPSILRIRRNNVPGEGKGPKELE